MNAAVQQQLVAYRRKYYLARVIRGALLVLILFLSVGTLFVISEGLLWLSPAFKTGLFLTFIGVVATVTCFLVMRPSLNYFGLLSPINDEDIARLIGAQLPQVQDKLLNYIQLSALPDQETALLRAAIESQTLRLKLIPFTGAIRMAAVFKLGRWLAVPVLVVAGAAAASPELIKGGGMRFLHFNRVYLPPPPYTIHVRGHQQKVIAGEGYPIEVHLGGQARPNELYLFMKRADEVQFERVLLQKKSLDSYTYTFTNLSKNFIYYIGDEVAGSEVLETRVLQRPTLGSFHVVLNYPTYTGLPAKQLADNVGDFEAVYGTVAEYTLSAGGNTSAIVYQSDYGKPLKLKEDGVFDFSMSQAVLNDLTYTFLVTSKEGIGNADTVHYTQRVVPDRFPTVKVQSPDAESAIPANGLMQLSTDFSDDYGISRAVLSYKFTRASKPEKVGSQHTLPIELPNAARKLFRVSTLVDWFREQVSPGDEIEYTVDAYDNDPFHGPKKASSTVHKLVYATVEDQYHQLSVQNTAVDSALKGLNAQTKAMQESLKEYEAKQLAEKEISYAAQQQLQQLINEHRELQNKLGKAAEQMEQAHKSAQEKNAASDELLKRQAELTEQLRGMQDPALQQQLEKLQDQINQLSKKELERAVKQEQRKLTGTRQTVERTLDLYKNWLIELKQEEIQKRLQDLQARQDLLHSQTEKSTTPEEQKQAQESQRSLQAEMQRLAQDLEKLAQMKQASRSPDAEQMQQLQEKAAEVTRKMNSAEQSISENKRREATELQQQSSKEMKEMEDALEAMGRDDNTKQTSEDYNLIRSLLDNLLKLSFSQEELRDIVAKLHPNDPSLTAQEDAQHRIKEQMAMLSDSLRAVAGRQPLVKESIFKSLTDIESSQERAERSLTDRFLGRAVGEQHAAMAGINELANLLVNSLQKMQQQMQQMKGKPKQGSGNTPSMRQLAQQQQELNNALQQQMDQQGQNGEQLAKQAEQQEAIRRQLQQAYEKLKQEGGQGLGSVDKISQDMQQTEKELLDKQLTKATLQRQQQVLSRMLDFDKAVREKEFEKERQSQTAKQLQAPDVSEWHPEKQDAQHQNEQLSQPLLQYTPAYEDLIEHYRQRLNTKHP